MNKFDEDPLYRAREEQSLKEFQRWYERLHGVEARESRPAVQNVNNLNLSAYDFKFLSDCGVKPE